jgi:hypothetical protein
MVKDFDIKDRGGELEKDNQSSYFKRAAQRVKAVDYIDSYNSIAENFLAAKTPPEPHFLAVTHNAATVCFRSWNSEE